MAWRRVALANSTVARKSMRLAHDENARQSGAWFPCNLDRGKVKPFCRFAFMGKRFAAAHCAAKEAIMHERLSGTMLAVAMAAAGVVIPISATSAQAPATSSGAATSALKNPWGEPDLQGIWTDETDTPLQRPARYASEDVFTPTQRAELDQARATVCTEMRVRSVGQRTTLLAATTRSSGPGSASEHARR